MALSIGIVGLPNVGKSTLFNALTRSDVLAANYPFATIDPNVGVVPLPDERLKVLAEVFGSEKIVPATVSFVDIAGIVKGASEGEGLGNQFLANIRESDAICQVTRGFEDPDVIHVNGKVDPDDDIETITTELVLADTQTVEKALPRLQKELSNKKVAKDYVDEVAKALKVLEDGRTLYSATTTDKLDLELLKPLQLLTAKPFIYVFNMDDDTLGNEDLKARLAASVAPATAVFLDAQFESELAELEEDEATEMLHDAGYEQSGLEQLAKAGYETLGLQSYLTAGPKETRAWTVKQGATAPEAAGVIHTDFQRGFIKAEVIGFDDLIAAGSVKAARDAGKARIEGKEYIMRDGDVVEFRFNV